MKGASASTAALLAMYTPGLLAHTVEYLEPTVQLHFGVVPPSVCKQLIELGEKAGFLVREESIDEEEQNDPTIKFIPSQTINVYAKNSDPGWNEEAEVEDEAIWDVLQPWIPTISGIVKANRNKEAFRKFYPDDPDREPELNWIFFRKYSPNDERNSLQMHHDSNMNTVNVALNDDYEGGGLFYVKPMVSTGEVSAEYNGVGYDWIDSVKKGNTTDILFPDLHTGDAIFYNYTVEHGVAPVESGIRYSMAFFFDMDNPAVENDFKEYDSEDDYDDIEVELHNGLPDIELDFVRVYEQGKGNMWKRVFDKVLPNETTVYYAYEGDKLLALVAGTEKVVFDIEIKPNQFLYTVALEYLDPGAQNDFGHELGNDAEDDSQDDYDDLEVELRNGLPDTELDIVRVHEAGKDRMWKRLFDKVTPNETAIYYAYEGDKLLALVAGTDEVVSGIEIKSNQFIYTLSHNMGSIGSEL